MNELRAASVAAPCDPRALRDLTDAEAIAKLKEHFPVAKVTSIDDVKYLEAQSRDKIWGCICIKEGSFTTDDVDELISKLE